MKKTYIYLFIVLVLGIAIGTQINKKSTKETHPMHTESEAVKEEVWTCSMHPSIRQDHPGKCPICGMDLIKMVDEDQTSDSEHLITLSPSALKNAEIETFEVRKLRPTKSITLSGRIERNETLDESQRVHIAGRIEKLNVHYQGQKVSKGEVIAKVYSPELITAQKEAITTTDQPLMHQAAINKLRQWKITDRQIRHIIKSRKVIEEFPILSEKSGFVTQINIKEGDYVSLGQKLFDTNSYASVWLSVDVFEMDQQHIKNKDLIYFDRSESTGYQNKTAIDFISPTVDQHTRTFIARGTIKNKDNQWLPGTYVNAKITIQEPDEVLVVPTTSVLWTGERSLVYKEVSSGKYEPLDVVLGKKYDEYYQISEGIELGDKIVSKGTFIIDASAELAHKKSMMTPSGSSKSTMNHGHHHMAMEGGMMHDDTDQQTTSFRVEGSCGMCKSRIEESITKLKGVHSASWDQETKMLKLEYSPSTITLDKIQKQIAKAGHDTEKFKASDEIYNNLPGCCQYRK